MEEKRLCAFCKVGKEVINGIMQCKVCYGKVKMLEKNDSTVIRLSSKCDMQYLENDQILAFRYGFYVPLLKPKSLNNLQSILGLDVFSTSFGSKLLDGLLFSL